MEAMTKSGEVGTGSFVDLTKLMHDRMPVRAVARAFFRFLFSVVVRRSRATRMSTKPVCKTLQRRAPVSQTKRTPHDLTTPQRRLAAPLKTTPGPIRADQAKSQQAPASSRAKLQHQQQSRGPHTPSALVKSGHVIPLAQPFYRRFASK